MSHSKSFASLSSGLLARKGAAKPAMRSQLWPTPAGRDEDLGWNDMDGGVEAPEHRPSSIEALTPAPRPGGDEEARSESPAARQQKEIAERLGEKEQADSVLSDAQRAKRLKEIKPTSRRPAGAKGKAAFTLRLDPDRHLRLRLACAVTNRSAQRLVTAAVDEFLTTLPEVEALAGKLPEKMKFD
ncbi:MAG: hypothetical protein ACFBQW_02895 [Sphingomonadaceae bacterium]